MGRLGVAPAALAAVLAACAESAAPPRSGTAPGPAFGVIGGVSCNEGNAWGEFGPHFPFDAPSWWVGNPGNPVTQCGNLNREDAHGVSWSWRGEEGHTDFQVTARVRYADGTSAFVPLFAGTVPPGVPASFASPIATGANADGIGIVMHYGDLDFPTATDEYFIGEPVGVPDRNNFAQIWLTIVPPSGLVASAPSSSTVQLNWSNAWATGPHYQTEIWQNGALAYTEGATTTSRLVSGLTPGVTYTFKVRMRSEPVVVLNVPGALSDLDVPVSDFSNTVQITTPTILTITSPATLPSGTVGIPYSYALQATGGSGTYSWIRTAGTLPPGLILSQGGLISGTPSSSGNSTFTAQVSSGGQVASKEFSLSIVQAAPFTASIDGPLEIGSMDQCMWVAEVSGSAGPFAYQWKKNNTVVGTDVSWTGGGTSTFFLRLKVTNTSTGAIASDVEKIVVYQSQWPNPC